MRKIPTLFVRDLSTGRVVDEIVPGCEWVGDPDVAQVATRKYDGTCTRCDETGLWWARREVKAGKAWPDGFVLEDEDRVTHKTVGWIPMTSSSYVPLWAEAIGSTDPEAWKPGTYELVGPRINGNPENVTSHQLVEHGRHMLFDVVLLRNDFEGLRLYLEYFAGEGIVWWAGDGRRAKIKRRDFGWK